MKRRDLIRHLESRGCVLIREGHSHSIYENSADGRRAPSRDIEKFPPRCAA